MFFGVGVIVYPKISINNSPMITLPFNIALIFGIIMCLIGLGHFFLGFGLWKKNNISRWTISIISAISVILAIIGILNSPILEVIIPNIILIIISIFIIYYLFFTKSAKRHFR